jgi:recombinational DNA repair ATPase RecF
MVVNSNYHQINNNLALDNIELDISKFAKSIIEAKCNFIANITDQIKIRNSDFPEFKIKIQNIFNDKNFDKSHSQSEFISSYSDEDLKLFEEEYPKLLKLYRLQDSKSKRTNFGVHRIDWEVIHGDKNISAKFCSTGEQKSLLISLLLAQMEAITHIYQASPILILDELFVHLDQKHSSLLSQFIIKNNIQSFISAISLNNLDDLIKDAQIIDLEKK